MSARATPSLRIARLTIESFRTFTSPVEIPLCVGDAADEVTVFHGPNGAGKSNALAALDLFFRASVLWTRTRSSQGSDELPLNWEVLESYSGLLPTSRDWPPGNRSPLRIALQFAEAKTPFTVTLTPAGNVVNLSLDGVWPRDAAPLPPHLNPLPPRAGLGLSPAEANHLSAVLNWVEAPLGPGSKPFFRLDARRRAYRFAGEGAANPNPYASPLSPDLADRLLALATSFDPLEIERWRAFVALVARFKTFAGREVAIVRMADGVADLRLEVRGKQILRVSELSSGEQQVLAMCAAVLTSRAAIVAIEEPEISLHPDYQKLVSDVLREQVRSGLLDQVILESHVPVFDGPEVVRFSRSADGSTSVVRQASAADHELLTLARKVGADAQWVTPEGYTRLPEEMVRALGFDAGGHLWFLRDAPEARWEAWTAAELDQMLGFPGRPSGK